MTWHNKDKDSDGALCSMHEDGDVRCFCGCLMAKIGKDGLEIKCKRCKRIQYIPLSQVIMEGAWQKPP